MSLAASPAQEINSYRLLSSPLSLIAVMALAFALRWWHVHEPLYLDEYGTAFAVMERTGLPDNFTAGKSDPLVPVANLQAVRDRSVFPFGIPNPVPLHHDIFYFFIKNLPIDTWSLRFPSVLAGIGCVAGIYFLVRQFVGGEAALLAALLAAIDPIQINVSGLARPYALGNLGCVLSFLFLFAIMNSRRNWTIALAGLGYGLSLAFVGYMNPVLMIVGASHLSLVLFEIKKHGIGKNRLKIIGWIGGCLLACLLLTPELDYYRQLREFSRIHRDYLILQGAPRLRSALLHNSTFLICLAVLSVAGYLIRELYGERSAEEKEVPGKSSPGSLQVVWLGRAWFFLPQIVILLWAFASRQPLYLTRYLSYTTLGGAILLAHLATHHGGRQTRLLLSATVVLAMAGWSFADMSKGFGLAVRSSAPTVLGLTHVAEVRGTWHEGDVLLIRSDFLEADFLPDEIPSDHRAMLERAIAAPFTTIRASEKRRPFILLSKSIRNRQFHTQEGETYRTEKLYNPALASRLKDYRQFWITSEPWNRLEFLRCFLPWLADSQECDVKVARFDKPYLEVWTDCDDEDFIKGLTNSKASDFNALVRIQRIRPKGIFTLSVLSSAAMPYSYFNVPVGIAAQARTPRLTGESPETEPEFMPEPKLKR